MAKLTKEHSAELSDLSDQQTKALADAIFVGMTAAEWLEYDNRHARILEILRRRWAGAGLTFGNSLKRICESHVKKPAMVSPKI